MIENSVIRNVLAGICISGMIIFVAPMIVGSIINTGNVFGGFICLIGTIFFLFNQQIMGFVYAHKALKISFRILCVLLCLCVALAIVFSVLMIRAGTARPDTEQPVIVLGCKVKGTRPSLMLAKRLDSAYEYLSGNNAVVIVSGGKGANEQISEAECMKNYLVSKGLDEKRIITEDKSTSTQENLEFSKKILEEKGLGTDVVIATDLFHQYRASLIAKETNLNVKAVSAKTSLWLVPTYWVREWFGLAQFFVFGN